METAFYNQTTLFTTKQTVSPLLLFHLNRASGRNVISKHQAKATQWSSPKDIIQAMWYLRNSLSLWYDLKLFIVCLQLAAVTGLLNRLGLSSIPLRERVECLALQLERNCCFLGKVTKITKCIGHKNPRKNHHCWQKLKTEDWIGENLRTVQDTKPKKAQILSAKTEKLNQKLAKSSKLKNPTTPSF